jgi:hypothetical protein
MTPRTFLSLSAITALGFALLSGGAIGQTKSLKEHLTGTWTFVSSNAVRPDGTNYQRGANPKGILLLEANGRFAQILLRSDVPKFKSNNRSEGTAEENKAVVEGTTASFGTWSVDEGNKTLILQVDGNVFPNLAGTESKRPFTLAGDELRVSNPTPAAGGKSESVFKRDK